jgi:hypothetical protein
MKRPDERGNRLVEDEHIRFRRQGPRDADALALSARQFMRIALRKLRTDPDQLGFALIGVSVPNFWIAILSVILLSVTLGWLPSAGYVPIEQGFWPSLVALIQPNGITREGMSPYAYPFNLTGHPSLAVPSGFASDGLPTSVQLTGRWWSDLDLLRIASTIEADRPCHQSYADIP